MTLIHGQVESLKKVKATLDSKSIDRFNSIRDINRFLENYNNELSDIDYKVEVHFLKELQEFKKQELTFEEYYNSIKADTENKLLEKILKLQAKVDKNGVVKLWRWLLKTKLSKLEKSFDRRIEKQLQTEKAKLSKIQQKRKKLEAGKCEIIEQRIFSERRELLRIKSIVDEMAPIIAGAIGESLVNKELQNLSDDYILINDFSRNFNPPIYNKKERERIFSIQVDHILISRSGVFVLETKNWSKKSLENLSLRSPVEQLRRTSYALFVLLNGNNNSTNRIGLKKHHWGDRNIPIRNLIVMINNRPKETFKYVQVKRLDELIRYVEYFEPIMNKEEVNNVYEYLKINNCSC